MYVYIYTVTPWPVRSPAYLSSQHPTACHQPPARPALCVCVYLLVLLVHVCQLLLYLSKVALSTGSVSRQQLRQSRMGGGREADSRTSSIMEEEEEEVSDVQF